MAVLRGISERKEYPLRGDQIVIGRDPECDIVIDSGQVSRRHARIVREEGGFFVEDLSSLNGTYVNGELIRQRTRLRPNDTIAIFDLLVAFQDDEPTRRFPTPTEFIDKPLAEAEPSYMATLSSSDLRLAIEPEAKLRAFLDMSAKLSNTLDMEDVLPKILESLFTIFPQADRGFILFTDPTTGQLVPKAARHRGGKETGPVLWSRQIVDRVVRDQEAVVSTDVACDSRFIPSKSIENFSIRSFMCVPMISQSNTVLGVIQTDTTDTRRSFRQEDLDVLVCASTQAARAIEMAALHEERRDLQAATQIQKSFLPSERPKVPGLRFFDYYASARHIGGDYYDYIPLPNNRLAVAMGDVCGKGVSAALLMARLSAAVRFGLATESSVCNAIRRLNNDLIQAGSPVRFITFTVLVIDLSDYSMTVVNAGHIPPLMRRSGSNQADNLADDVAGMPLGIMPMDYEQTTLTLGPGDTVVLCTDGVTESRNQLGEFYETDRLRRFISRAPQDVEELGSAIMADVRRFSVGCPQSDDIALVCFGRVP